VDAFNHIKDFRQIKTEEQIEIEIIDGLLGV
jgi:hypothetical protein